MADNDNTSEHVEDSNSKEESGELSEEELKNYDARVLDSGNKSLLMSVLKQIKVGAEVKHLQLPAFLLYPQSLLETLSSYFSYPDMLERTSSMSDPEERFVNIVRWYISGFNKRPKGCRNPLNPIIGEIFKCDWDTSNKKAHYFAEQISHHPPHSAFCFYNVEKGVAVNGNFAPSYVKFFGNSAETRVSGVMKVVVVGKDFKEEYECTWPSFKVKGIIFGTLLLEIIGKVSITCEQTKYKAEIDFKSKGLFGGKYNEINGKIKKGLMKTLYTINGFWDSEIYFTKDGSKEKNKFFDPKEHKEEEKTVSPLTDQLPNESRKLWADVIKGILHNNEEEALEPKRKLEAIQRKEEADRKENKTTWVPSHFVLQHKFDSTSESWVYNKWNDILQQLNK